MLARKWPDELYVEFERDYVLIQGLPNSSTWRKTP